MKKFPEIIQNVVVVTFLALVIVVVVMSCTRRYSLVMAEFFDNVNKKCREADGDLQQLRIVSYSYMGEIKSDEEKCRIINDMLSDDAPISIVLTNIIQNDTVVTDTDSVIVQKSFPMFDVTTVRQAICSGSLSTDSIAVVKQRLQENIKIGAGYLEILYNYKEKEYRTLSVMDMHVPNDLINCVISSGSCTVIKSISQQNE